ncbi:MAG TPA: lysylphosphatidylglycerol synthase domain-containing protein [Melioribacteraceae bacterium]|mgnify:CR=1 FL=1|nr:lysylphosphatidylglycerol synthase domain-containing protein [Melioribacteraceae bacterium]
MALRNFILNKKIIFNLAKLILSAILIVFLVSYLKLNSNFVSFNNANVYLIIFAIVLLPLNIFIQYKRWQILCYTVEKSSKIIIIKSIFLGIAAGLITPLKAGEFIGRAYILNKSKIKEYTLLSIYDRLVSMLITVFVGTLFVLVYLFPLNKIIINYFIIGIVLFFITILVIFFIIKNKHKLLEIKQIKVIIHVLTSIDVRTNIKLICLAFIFFFTYIIQFALLLSAFNGFNNFLQFVSAGVLVFFTNTIIPPVTFGEIGIREGAAVFFANYFPYIAQTGFASSIILFTINVIIPSVIGLIIYLREK